MDTLFNISERAAGNAAGKNTPEQKAVEFYEKNGWYISDFVFDSALMDACVESAERIYRGEYDHVQPWSDSPLFPNFRKPYTERTELRVDQFPSFHSDFIRQVTHSPEVAAIAANLLRTDEIRYYKDILIGTPTQEYVDKSAIGWHIDSSYWPTCLPEKMLTVYVPLQDRTEKNGTLVMINGSHKWVNKSFNITAEFGDFEKIRRKYENQGYRIEMEPMPHKRGQVSFHSSLVIHATYPNVTNEFQHTIVSGLQANENRFVPSPMKRLNKSLVVNINDEISPLLHDGSPDIRNSSFYPLLYPAKKNN
jgi:hypothetical protein